MEATNRDEYVTNFDINDLTYITDKTCTVLLSNNWTTMDDKNLDTVNSVNENCDTVHKDIANIGHDEVIKILLSMEINIGWPWTML